MPTKKKHSPKKSPPIWRLRVLCVAGPYWDSDDTCLRAIDVPEGISLYDLHAAILESVHFEEHDESVFTFFTARDYRGRRTYLGDGEPLTHETDIELFEDVALSSVLPSDGKSFLYYVFDADDPWVFLIGREPEPRAPSPHEFYPLVRDELNIGPDPTQHGDGLDDFADADEGAEFDDLRREFRRQRRVREESGLDDDELEAAAGDDSAVVPDIFATDDEDDDFFDEDDEENRNPYAEGYNDDDNW